MVIRSTHQSTTRMYISAMHNSQSHMNSLRDKVLTERKFTRASENAIGASRAMRVREAFSNMTMHKDNLDMAKGIYITSESILTESVSQRTITVNTHLLDAVNGTKTQQERDIIASEIEGIGLNMIKDMNSNFAGRRLFGGTNDGDTAFKVENGSVSYNGIPVNTNRVDFVPGDPAATPPVKDVYLFGGKEITAAQAKGPNHSRFPSTDEIWIDVGIGIKYDEKGNVDPTTAMNLSLNGVEFTGSGVDEDGLSNSIVQLTFDAVKALRDGDNEQALRIVDKITDANSSLLIGIANLGIRQSAVDMSLSSIEVERLNLAEEQIKVEGMSELDIAKAMTDFKSVERTYNATLQMGSAVVPLSIFDYIR